MKLDVKTVLKCDIRSTKAAEERFEEADPIAYESKDVETKHRNIVILIIIVISISEMKAEGKRKSQRGQRVTGRTV